MGTKSSYILCSNCGQLSPSAAYFYAKGELTDEEKKMCIWCLEKRKHPEEIPDQETLFDYKLKKTSK